MFKQVNSHYLIEWPVYLLICGSIYSNRTVFLNFVYFKSPKRIDNSINKVMWPPEDEGSALVDVLAGRRAGGAEVIINGYWEDVQL